MLYRRSQLHMACQTLDIFCTQICCSVVRNIYQTWSTFCVFILKLSTDISGWREVCTNNTKWTLPLHHFKRKSLFGIALLRPPLSDIFFWDPHDITRYFTIWYDYHTILTIFHNTWSVQNLSKNSAKRVIFMSDTHNGLGWMHQMHKRGKKICQFMLKVCLYKCKESSDLNFRGKLKAIYSAYIIINIVWYFQKNAISIF